jgi:RNA polymerase sigma-70 factor (ECF subfamily)
MNLALVSEGMFLEAKTYPQMNDQELMQLLVAENLGAWSELVKRYGNLVYSIAYQVLNNSSDAEDAVQNTFVRLKIYSGKFDHSQPLKPWLSQIASGEAIRIYNKKKNINKKESSRMEPQNYSIPSPKQDVSEVAAQKEIEVMVKKAIELLPEISRVAITLYYVGGMSQTEIAKELGLSQFSISEKIKMGLEKVKLHLKKSGVHASIAISPLLVQESLSSGEFPIEFSQKLTQSLPTKVQIASVEATKTNVGFWSIKTKILVLILSSSVLILGGILYYFHSHKMAAPIQQLLESNKKKVIMLGAGNPESVPIEAPIEVNKFQPMSFHNFIPVGVKFVAFKKDLKMPDIVEGNAQIIGGISNWKIGKDKKNNNYAYRNIISGVDELDGFYFNQSFKQPYIFKGKIKINSNRNKITLLMSTPMKEESFQEINPKNSDKFAYSRFTCQMSSLQGDKGNSLDYKVFIWVFNGKLVSATFIKCIGFPETMIVRSIPVFNEEFKVGFLSNGMLELSDAEFCPLPVDWDCQMAPEIKQRIKEIPKEFYEKTATK